MFFTVKKWTLLYILLLLVIFGGFAAIVEQGSEIRTVSAQIRPAAERPVLIIDAGHGGEDGGAAAADGTREADINLTLSLQMEELAAFLGVETLLTRREDVSIHDSGLDTFRARKTSDLKNRAALTASVPNGILVSIHQNKLPGYPTVRGAQVFYFREKENDAVLAAAVQEHLNQAVNGQRSKVSKAAGDEIYLLAHAACPAILVECGFLSNEEETALLRSKAYQTRLTVTILAGVLSAAS